MNMQIQGFIFDYGGTLDTGGCHWAQMLWQAYQRAGVPVTEQQFKDAYVHVERLLGRESFIHADDTFRTTLSKKILLQLSFLGQSHAYQTALLYDLYPQVCHHTAHSREVLLQLKERYPLVLVSNFYGNLSAVLREFGFEDIFQHVIESAAVGIRKPDVRIFQLGIQALGMPPEHIAVVGDSMKNDILPAQQAGCQTIQLKGDITDINELLNL